MIAWLKSWKERRDLKKTMRLMLPLLRKRYGVAEFYSSGQVLKTAELIRLKQAQKICVIAMFVKPADAVDVLREADCFESYEQIRKRLLEISFKEYGEDNFEENLFVLYSGSSGDSGMGGGAGDYSGGDSGGGHH